MIEPLKPLCFVLMPFGPKKDPKGGPDIQFDRIYESIRLAIIAAGMEPLRADAEQTGGIIHKTMFERLLLCDYAVADLSTANPNVFYELGVRHTARPRSTVALSAIGYDVPFDVRYVRYVPYRLAHDNGFGDQEAHDLTARLAATLASCRDIAKHDATDSPLFQLLKGYQAPELAHLVTDAFRERALYSEGMRSRISSARSQERDKALSALRAIEKELTSNIDGVEFASLVDLFLSYRAIEEFDAMISLYDAFPDELKRTVMLREQLAFAYNRRTKTALAQPGDRERALAILSAIEAERGANPETCGLIGRIHKDRFVEARNSGNDIEAAGHLDAAIDAYVRGYEADWRDFYPGVNAVSLLDVRGNPEDLVRRDRLIPVVQYALDRRMGAQDVGYWDYATQLELAVLTYDRRQALKHLSRAVASIREGWEPKTTANNLRLIIEARSNRGEPTEWIQAIVAGLQQRGARQVDAALQDRDFQKHDILPLPGAPSA